MMLSEINDHCTNGEAIVKENGFYVTKNGTRHRKMTTRGWELCAEWKEGSYDLVSLKDLKNLYPIELAEYAINNKIDDQPAFAWWVPHTFKKRE